MQTRTVSWAILGVVTVGVGGVLALQAQRNRQLEAELAALRSEQMTLQTLRAERQELQAAQPSADQWTEWRMHEAERGRCEAEIAQLRTRLASKSAAKPGAPAEFHPSEAVQASAWSNAGRASPEAVLETALWAAVGGEVEALAETLLLEPETRAQAEALLARLPETMRVNYATPERLVALLTAREVPMGTMQLIARMERGPDVLLRVRLQQPDGSSVTKSLVARGTPGDWRLVVPANAIKHFETILRGPTS